MNAEALGLAAEPLREIALIGPGGVPPLEMGLTQGSSKSASKVDKATSEVKVSKPSIPYYKLFRPVSKPKESPDSCLMPDNMLTNTMCMQLC